MTIRCSVFATVRYSLFGFSRHPARNSLSTTGEHIICFDYEIVQHKAVTIEDYSSLFATIRHYSPLFATVRTIRYSRLFAVRYSLFATIRYSGFPDTHLKFIIFTSGGVKKPASKDTGDRKTVMSKQE